MLIPTFQMRAPSKRWIVAAGVLVTSLVSIAWSFDRFVLHARGFGGAPASSKERAETRPLGRVRVDAPESRSNTETALIDSYIDSIPGAAKPPPFPYPQRSHACIPS